MFFQFFDELRAARIPVTLKEYLALMDALSHDVIEMKVDEFYYLSRTALVKDERNLDKFDQVFGHVFKGLEGIDASLLAAEEAMRQIQMPQSDRHTVSFLIRSHMELSSAMRSRDLADPKVQQTIRETLINRKDQLLKAAYYEMARNEAKVTNYFANRIAMGHEKK